MPSSVRDYLVLALRVVLVGGGGLVAVGAGVELATIPPAPPESEGFVTGLAYIFGGVILVVALGVAALGVALPSMLGVDDGLGFGRWQRLALKGAGALLGGGFLVAVGLAATVGFQFGAFAFLVAVAVGVLVVVGTVGWRLGEVLLTAAADAVG